jgi:hypothetical protein
MDDPLLPGQSPEPGDYDHPDPDGERQRRAEASLREERLREVERSILSTPTGREWLWGVLNGMHVFEQRMAMTASAYENGFFAGERESGLRLLQRFLRGSPADFSRMFSEHDKS